MFVLFHATILVVLYGLALGLGNLLYDPASSSDALFLSYILPLFLYYFATFVPSLAVGSRRLHDTGRSGLWLLLALIPGGFGGIVLFVFFCLDGQRQPNQFGPDPKAPPGQQFMPRYHRQSGYPNQPSYPAPPGYPNRAGYPAQLGYPNQPGYPPQQSYPNQPGQGFPNQRR